jgi:hypothetical protein
VTTRVSLDGLHLSGWHDGYRRLRGRPVHHRELAFVPEGGLAVWDTVESRVPQDAVSRVRFAPGARVELASPDAALIEVGGVPLGLRAFGGALYLEPGHYAPRFGERLACPVLALRKGETPEFGYVLARRGLQARIDAAGAEVAARPLLRSNRRSADGGTHA